MGLTGDDWWIDPWWIDPWGKPFGKSSVPGRFHGWMSWVQAQVRAPMKAMAYKAYAWHAYIVGSTINPTVKLETWGPKIGKTHWTMMNIELQTMRFLRELKDLCLDKPASWIHLQSTDRWRMQWSQRRKTRWQTCQSSNIENTASRSVVHFILPSDTLASRWFTRLKQWFSTALYVKRYRSFHHWPPIGPNKTAPVDGRERFGAIMKWGAKELLSEFPNHIQGEVAKLMQTTWLTR